MISSSLTNYPTSPNPLVPMRHAVPLDGHRSESFSPFLQCRTDRRIPQGDYMSPNKQAPIARPSAHETKVPFVDIYSPKPVRAFQTAEFMDTYRVAQGDWNTLVASQSPIYDSSYDASKAQTVSSVPSTPSPLSMPPWPSTNLAFSLRSLGLYPLSPSPTSDDDSQRLFEYVSLNTQGYKKSARFDPFSEDDAAPVSPPDLYTFSSPESTYSDDPFYTVPSTPESTYDTDIESDSSSPRSKSSSQSPALACSSPATSINSGISDAENMEAELFLEAVHLSTRVLSLDERKGCMDEQEWKAEMGKVLALWRGMFTKGVGERILDDQNIGGRSGD